MQVSYIVGKLVAKFLLKHDLLFDILAVMSPDIRYYKIKLRSWGVVFTGISTNFTNKIHLVAWRSARASER